MVEIIKLRLVSNLVSRIKALETDLYPQHRVSTDHWAKNRICVVVRLYQQCKGLTIQFLGSIVGAAAKNHSKALLQLKNPCMLYFFPSIVQK